ncbi:hypothetical protein [Ahniella affigens]|uniref:hypothetical protein n=1 Tax=Ahniella affigens TaxID=2021234 RepID=UPI001474AEBF|nr:hypothetical protein [Ahniella affigens]
MSQTHTLIALWAAFCPYLALALYDGWLHEKARRVPKLEQLSHGLIFVSVIALWTGLYHQHTLLTRGALAVFTVTAFIDEWVYHGPLHGHERRLHFIAYTCFAGFVGVAAWLGRI